MKSIRNHASRFVYVLALVGLLCIGVPKLFAQAGNFNLAPCDFNDTFYKENGIDVNVLNRQVSGRFGNFRQFGPPATSSTQPNWVADEDNCLEKDPDRRNIRILATTGGYPDDNTGSATEFISLIAFLPTQDVFLQTFSRSVGGSTISIVNGHNPRGIQMVDIVGNFEAYAAEKQRLTSGPFAGKLAPTPCGTMFDKSPGFPANSPCFSVASEATPALRQDWRFATNRSAMDGSDGNCINNDTTVCPSINDAPFGYFCDDLLGMWVITYFWYTHHSVGNPVNGEQPDQTQCVPMLRQLSSMHGNNLDGTPIVLTANELNFLEGKNVGAQPLGPNFPNPPSFPDGEGCMQEGRVDTSTSSLDFPAASWLICPAIPDPRNGAIASDAFLDQVRKPDGTPLDPRLTNNFHCLQTTGHFADANGSCSGPPIM